jgi:hypothetical protein|tara:strand:- start:103 stop:285 length:183 start_codon:yes stop_codon:yes gene_type:complete
VDYELADFCARGGEFTSFLSTSIIVMMFLFALHSINGLTEKLRDAAGLVARLVANKRKHD